MTLDTDRKPRAVAIEPKGAWRHNRFEFCNALEAALDEGTIGEASIRAWAELARLGVHRANGEPRSSVVPGVGK